MTAASFKLFNHMVNILLQLADPVTNWARLCIGVLNKMYGEEELELRASQLMYLQDREGYLDDELASHSDLAQHQSNMSLLKTNTFQLLQVSLQICIECKEPFKAMLALSV